MKLKLLTTNDDEEDEAASPSPQGHIGPSPFGVFSMDTVESEIRNNILSSSNMRSLSLWPWNGNERKDDSLVAKLCRFGWQRLYVIQEQKMPSRLRRNNHSLDYEIMWEDLITKRLIGQGYC